ncbi:MAG: hypothetical protein EYR95_11155 [Phormidium sp. SL48-SHIP]|nr:MAG: hypothetical protein EYR95_11155 [Phormidium sp. SL48-SHIP]
MLSNLCLPTHLSRLRSLCLTTVFSFMLPGLVFAAGALALFVMSYIPLCTQIGHAGLHWLLEFLAVFGTGHPLQGLLWLGFSFSFVAVLFDMFASFHTVQEQHER